MNNIIEQYKYLVEYLCEELRSKVTECNSYKLKLVEIQKVLNSEVKEFREGTIKETEGNE